MSRHGIAALLLTAVLASCASRPIPTPSRALGPGERWLPVANWTLPDGSTLLCAGVGFVGDIRLRGAPDDPRLVWMVYPDGSRTDLAWPVGYSARFAPHSNCSMPPDALSDEMARWSPEDARHRSEE